MKNIKAVITMSLMMMTSMTFAQHKALYGIAKLNGKSELTTMEAQTFVLKPKGNIKDLVINIGNIQSALIIQGSDRDDIHMKAEGLLELPDKAKGLRNVSLNGEDNTSLSLSVEQIGDEIRILGTNLKRSKKAVFTLTVPSQISIKIDYAKWNSEDLIIKDIQGGIEAKSSIANIMLTDVTGPLSITSLSGDINVKYSKVNSSEPTALSSSSGDIDITIAESASVEFRLRNSGGEIYTDLDVKFEEVVRKEESNNVKELKKNSLNLSYPQQGQSQRKFLVGFLGRKDMSGKLNGGELDFSITTINGDVYLRKK